MNDDPLKKHSEADAEIEREIRRERKFSLAEAIGRMAGPGALKGVSPVAQLQQAEAEIKNWLRIHLTDPAGGLELALNRSVKESELLAKNFEQPLRVLEDYCQKILDSSFLLEELVRQADVEWGQLFDRRPYFETDGAPAHPDDPYTIESVRRKLSDLIEQLKRVEKDNHKDS